MTSLVQYRCEAVAIPLHSGDRRRPEPMNPLIAMLGIVGVVLALDVVAVTLGTDSRDTLPDDHRR
jgi:hypothetical protein